MEERPAELGALQAAFAGRAQIQQWTRGAEPLNPRHDDAGGAGPPLTPPPERVALLRIAGADYARRTAV